MPCKVLHELDHVISLCSYLALFSAHFALASWSLACFQIILDSPPEHILAFALPSGQNAPLQIYHGQPFYQLHFFTQKSPSQTIFSGKSYIKLQFSYLSQFSSSQLCHFPKYFIFIYSSSFYHQKESSVGLQCIHSS